MEMDAQMNVFNTLNGTLRNGQDGKFHVYFTTIYKIYKINQFLMFQMFEILASHEKLKKLH